jgi:hypothetical protein
MSVDYRLQRFAYLVLLVSAAVLAGRLVGGFLAIDFSSPYPSFVAPQLPGNTAHAASTYESSQQIGMGQHAPQKVDDWVHTRTGWERRSNWAPRIYQPALHPAIVAALVCLTSLWGLMTFPADDSTQPEET